MSSTESTSEDAYGGSHTVYRKPTDFVSIALVVAALATAGWGIGDHVYKTNQIAALTQDYDAEYVALGGGRGYENRSWFDGVTLSVLKNGKLETCKNVHFEDLRAGNPIECKNGFVFRKKQ